MSPLVIMVVALTSVVCSSCTPSAVPSTNQLEANDTIVSLGNYRVLIPRAAACDWKFIGTTPTPDASIAFDGCGEQLYSVTIGAVVFHGIDRLGQERLGEFMRAAQSNVEHDCSAETLREGRVSNKRWILCEGPSMTSATDTQYTLHVIIEEKKYYFNFSCVISTDYFETFERSGEIERIVNKVQLWPSD